MCAFRGTSVFFLLWASQRLKWQNLKVLNVLKRTQKYSYQYYIPVNSDVISLDWALYWPRHQKRTYGVHWGPICIRHRQYISTSDHHAPLSAAVQWSPMLSYNDCVCVCVCSERISLVSALEGMMRAQDETFTRILAQSLILEFGFRV